MKKHYLLTPGPTPIPENISSLFARPLIHHRTPAFEALFADVRAGLKYLFQTEAEVLTLCATGTGAMDAAVSNLCSRGEKVITVNGGKFGDRWTKLARTYGLEPIEIFVERGRTLELAKLEEAIRANPGAKAVLFQASETSTGVQMPTREIVARAQKAGMLTVCDAITACGVFELPMDAWGIDVLITGSQKALMIPPGLAFIALSAKAWAAVEKSDLPKFYFDLRKELKSQVKNQSAWTPGTQLIIGLQEALRMIREETLEKCFARHDLLARATRAGVKAMSLELFATEAPSTAVTAVKVPAQIADGKSIPRGMRKYGITIAGGQDELEGKIFRLSHFGYCGPFDVTTALGGLELVLADLKFPVQFGRGVGAALQTLSGEWKE